MGVDEASVVPFIFKRLHKKWELQEIASVDIYDLGARVPHICHFFTQAKFLENKIYTEKRVNYDKLHSKLPILRVNYDKLHSKLPIFRVKSVEIYTGQFFLHRHCLWCL